MNQKEYYKLTHRIILINDITEKATFDNLRKIIKDILNKYSNKALIFLGDNLKDYEGKRTIKTKEGINV